MLAARSGFALCVLHFAQNSVESGKGASNVKLSRWAYEPSGVDNTVIFSDFLLFVEEDNANFFKHTHECSRAMYLFERFVFQSYVSSTQLFFLQWFPLRFFFLNEDHRQEIISDGDNILRGSVLLQMLCSYL